MHVTIKLFNVEGTEQLHGLIHNLVTLREKGGQQGNLIELFKFPFAMIGV